MRFNIGAHMSIQGGFDRAVGRARDVGCECLQIFTKSNMQWRARPLADDETNRFRRRCRQLGIGPAIGHASYLLNLASGDAALRQRSVAALVLEMERARQLGLTDMVLHPGAYTDSTPEDGLKRIIDGVREVLRQTKGSRVRLCLETTAGAGSVLGGKFEHLAKIITAARSQRLGVCFDTCHVFAAGYDISTETGCRRVMAELDRVIGFARLRVMHLNDAKAPLGSRKDRHAHIGEGALGLTPFRWIMRQPDLRPIPKILETPKGDCGGRDWDAVSLDRLRKLAR